MYNTITIQFIADLAVQPADLILNKLAARFGDDLPVIYDWTATTELSESQADVILDYLGLASQKETAIGEAELQIEEAIQITVYKLTQSLSVNVDQVTKVLDTQNQVAGTISGLTGAMEFTDNYLTSYSSFMGEVTKEVGLLGQQKVLQLKSKVMQLTGNASDRLGELVRQQQQTEEILKKLTKETDALTKGLRKSSSK